MLSNQIGIRSVFFPFCLKTLLKHVDLCCLLPDPVSFHTHTNSHYPSTLSNSRSFKLLFFPTPHYECFDSSDHSWLANLIPLSHPRCCLSERLFSPFFCCLTQIITPLQLCLHNLENCSFSVTVFSLSICLHSLPSEFRCASQCVWES